MKKSFKITALIIAGVGLGLQWVPVDRSNPPVVADFDGPPEVAEVLRRSCYDCHSHETEWPWYSYVAPVSWLVAHDVEEGREELNFSDWPRFRENAKLIGEIAEEVEEGEMPLPLYLLTHRGAEVTPAELEILQAWAHETESILRAKETRE